MLTIRLYPAEFWALIYFLRGCTHNQTAVPLSQQSVGMLLLLEYHRFWRPERLDRWACKRLDRQHNLKVSLPVIKVLHQELQQVPLSPPYLALLAKIDLAIVNYQSPYAKPHALGELVRQAMLPGV